MDIFGFFLQSLSIDNGRLKEKEKKLVKDSIKLNRNVRVSEYMQGGLEWS